MLNGKLVRMNLSDLDLCLNVLWTLILGLSIFG